MTAETCKHCGQHPYEYIDVCRGAAKPEVVCCDKALLETFNRGETVIDGLHEVASLVGSLNTGWISIDDRLPELRKTVMLSIEWLTPTEDDEGEWHEDRGTVVELGELTPSDNGFYFQAYASHGTHEYISHWMPLPEPMPLREAK